VKPAIRGLAPMEHGAMAHLEVFLAQLQALFKPQALQQGPGGVVEGLPMGRLGCGVIDLRRAFKITALTEEFLT